MTKNNLEKKILYLKITVGLFGTIIIGSYVLNFYNAGLSKDSGDWGTFGDYIGGLLNPVLSFINILITYYIARMINEFSKRENDRQDLTQIKIIKSQIRFDALNDFRNDIDKLFGKINDSSIEERYELTQHFVNETIDLIESFKINYDHLFNEQPNFHVRLVSDLKSISSTMKEHKQVQNLVGNRQLNLMEKIKSVKITKDSMISYLNNQIIRKLEQSGDAASA